MSCQLWFASFTTKTSLFDGFQNIDIHINDQLFTVNQPKSDIRLCRSRGFNKKSNMRGIFQSSTTTQIRAYNELSSKPVYFLYLSYTLIEVALSSHNFSGTNPLGNSLKDLEYTNDTVPFGEDANKMQSFYRRHW